MVGLVISVLQAATQINEATLSFVPKILAVCIGLAVFGPWIISKMITYAAGLFGNLALYAR